MWEPSEIIDISAVISTELVTWMGDPGIELHRVQSLAAGDSCNVTDLHLGAHTGTHVDAPIHFVKDGEGIAGVDLRRFVGPARVVYLPNRQVITADDLAPMAPACDEILLLKTENSLLPMTPPLRRDYVGISASAAEYLVECGIRTIGIDYLSIGPFEADLVTVHQQLLGAKIAVIEGLRLAHVEEGQYLLVCQPLAIAGCDGSPVRALLLR